VSLIAKHYGGARALSKTISTVAAVWRRVCHSTFHSLFFYTIFTSFIFCLEHRSADCRHHSPT